MTAFVEPHPPHFALNGKIGDGLSEDAKSKSSNWQSHLVDLNCGLYKTAKLVCNNANLDARLAGIPLVLAALARTPHVLNLTVHVSPPTSSPNPLACISIFPPVVPGTGTNS
jgi:hypothetical protein